MNRKYNIFAIPALAFMLMLGSCGNSDETSITVEPVDLSNTAVSAFALKPDKTVLNNLDSVFFTIDLNGARIFNADSLPYGTKIDKLKISLTTEASAVTVFSPKEGSTEVEEIDLLANSDATVNFSAGDVRVKVVAYDGVSSRDYHIKVNVHAVEPDSLFWSELARTTLPTSLPSPTAQKSVKFAGKLYCLASDGTAYTMGISDKPFDNVWTTSTISFPQAVDVRSLTATDDALYVLALDGSLLQSADGASWASTGETWRSITAPYGGTLIGIKTVGGAYEFASYPAGLSIGSVPSDFPLGGNSVAQMFSSKWAADNQIVTCGGKSASGEVLNATWAFDGAKWAKISESLPALDGVAVTKCTICEVDTVSWRALESSVLLAFGGRKADGSLSSDVYISRDLGMNWKKGDCYLQFPDYMPAFCNADVLEFSHEFHVVRSASSGWYPMTVNVPFFLTPWNPANSRVAVLPTSWECPFLYMFGGDGENGALYDTVWRGVVNHFTFYPLN